MCSMMYDIIVFENLRFRPHENEEVAFLKKKIHSGDRFRKPACLVPENAAYLWTEG